MRRCSPCRAMFSAADNPQPRQAEHGLQPCHKGRTAPSACNGLRAQVTRRRCRGSPEAEAQGITEHSAALPGAGSDRRQRSIWATWSGVRWRRHEQRDAKMYCQETAIREPQQGKTPEIGLHEPLNRKAARRSAITALSREIQGQQASFPGNAEAKLQTTRRGKTYPRYGHGPPNL